MKPLHASLPVGALTLLLAFSVSATTPSQSASQGQDPSLVADQLAQRIRVQEGEVSSESRTVALLAISREGAALASTLDPNSGAWRRVQADRLYALFLAQRYPDVVAVFRALEGQRAEPPSYVIAAIAEALAKTGQAGEAGQLLQGAVSANPADTAAAIRYAYSLADQGQHNTAIQYLDQWIANAPRQAPDMPAANADAQLVLARLQRWDERFDDAERTLAQVDASKAGESLVVERAALQRQRARPRAAIELIDHTGNRDARETLALAWMDLGRPDRAYAVLGMDGDADLQKRIELTMRSRGAISARYGESRSAAIASPNGAQESSMSVRVDGPLLADGWRIGAHLADHRAQFRDATPVARYAGVRLGRTLTGGEAALEAGRSFDRFLPQAYAVLDSSVWTSDQLRLGARLGINDPESSLQARASGIGSDTAAISATYRHGERWRIDGGLQAAHFDDGNRRQSVSFGGEARIRAHAGTVTSAFASVYASANSLHDAAYFNPRRDASVEAGLVHGFRGFAKSWQSVRPSVVEYWQQGFGSHLVPRLGYAMRFGAGAGRWWQLDLAAARPVYDGRRETQGSIALGYGWGD
ncbi:MAG: tetratricopeptide repeat protein [Thermomonas sp.]